MQGILDGTIDEKEREQYLAIVLDETKRLNALISDLLDLAKGRERTVSSAQDRVGLE